MSVLLKSALTQLLVHLRDIWPVCACSIASSSFWDRGPLERLFLGVRAAFGAFFAPWRCHDPLGLGPKVSEPFLRGRRPKVRGGSLGYGTVLTIACWRQLSHCT